MVLFVLRSKSCFSRLNLTNFKLIMVPTDYAISPYTVASSDPNVLVELTKAVILREKYVKRLKNSETLCLKELRGQLQLLADLIRNETISVINLISSWKKSQIDVR